MLEGVEVSTCTSIMRRYLVTVFAMCGRVLSCIRRMWFPMNGTKSIKWFFSVFKVIWFIQGSPVNRDEGGMGIERYTITEHFESTLERFHRCNAANTITFTTSTIDSREHTVSQYPHPQIWVLLLALSKCLQYYPVSMNQLTTIWLRSVVHT